MTDNCFRKILIGVFSSYFLSSASVQAMMSEDEIGASTSGASARAGVSVGRDVRQAALQAAVGHTVTQTHIEHHHHAVRLEKRPFISNLPAPQRFMREALIERADLREALQNGLEREQVVVIRGPMGTGKTTLAFVYARDWPSHHVRWFKADSLASLSQGYRDFARDEGIVVERQDDDDVRNQIYAYLRCHPNSLLVFDNVEREEDLQSYLSHLPPIVKALLTTRSTRVYETLSFVLVDDFKEKQALQFLTRSLGDKRALSGEEAKALTEIAGRLPIRLSWVVAYLRDHLTLSVKKFLGIVEKKKSKRRVLDPIFTLVIETLKVKSPLGWQLLRQAALLDPDFIPLEVFVTEQEESEDIEPALAALESLSLATVIHKESGITGINVHRLAQEESLRYGEIYREEAPSLLLGLLIKRLDGLLPSINNVPDEKWQQAKYYTPHAKCIVNHKDDREFDIEKALLFIKLCKYYCTVLHQYQKALDYGRRALKIIMPLSEVQNDLAATIHIEIGITYASLGQDKKALDSYTQALTMRRALYGEGVNHPTIATSLNNIGLVYRSLGQHHEALEYYSQALTMRRALYGEGVNHPHIATSLNNIGAAQDGLGQHQDALKYYTEALLMWRALYGESTNHPAIATSLNNTGAAYNDLGQYHQALEYYTEALLMWQALYSKSTNHPDIANCLNNIGRLHHCLGQYQDALDYYTEALTMRWALYGEDITHPAIANCLNNIGAAHRNLGEYDEALDYFTQALTMLRNLYGEDTSHPAIANCLNSIGGAHHDLGQYQKALKYFTQALMMWWALYGESANHPYIANSLNNTGAVYNDLGQHQEALEYFTQTLVMEQDLYGEDTNHPDIAASLSNIGTAYEGLGQYQEALQYYTQALAMWRALYGEDINHPDIAHCLKNIGRCYASQLHRTVKWVAGIKRPWVRRGLLSIRHFLPGQRSLFDQALSYFVQSYTLLSGQFDESHPRVLEVRELILALDPGYDFSHISTQGEAEEVPEDAQGPNPSGQGGVMANERPLPFVHQAFLTYYAKGLNTLLRLRINSIEGGVSQRVKVVPSQWLRQSGLSLIPALRKLQENEVAMIPINLWGQHWVGVVIERNSGNVNVTYLDSENKPIPQALEKALREVMAATHPQLPLHLIQLRVEQQRYTNCGPEVIENFAQYLTGVRVSQEEAVPLHSRLLEENLAGTTFGKRAPKATYHVTLSPAAPLLSEKLQAQMVHYRETGEILPTLQEAIAEGLVSVEQERARKDAHGALLSAAPQGPKHSLYHKSMQVPFSHDPYGDKLMVQAEYFARTGHMFTTLHQTLGERGLPLFDSRRGRIQDERAGTRSHIVNSLISFSH